MEPTIKLEPDGYGGKTWHRECHCAVKDGTEWQHEEDCPMARECQCENACHANGCTLMAALTWPTVHGPYRVCFDCDEQHRPPAEYMKPEPVRTFAGRVLADNPVRQTNGE